VAETAATLEKARSDLAHCTVVAPFDGRIVRRRPNIRRAEADTYAATARIGVATADLSSRCTISGTAGLQSRNLGEGLNWASRLWSFAPTVSWRVFNMRRIRSNIKLEKSLQEEILIGYEQTVVGR
jgi:multidrug efflux system outer membrane protein